MKIQWIATVVLLLLVAAISGIHGAFLSALISLIVFIVLCLSAYPVSRLLLQDPVDALLFTFPAGYAVHALLMSLTGLVA